MKNQYVADINDYRKYGLIRMLSDGGKIRTGVCWMLTPNDNRTDGKFTQYIYAPEIWKKYDSNLFDSLKNSLLNGDRNVQYIEDTDIIPNAIYHNDILSDNTKERSGYFAKMQDRLKSADLIFFDPDNGIEVKSRPYGRKNSSKFLYWDELSHAYKAGKSVLVYQHFIRENRRQFISRLSAGIRERLGAAEVLPFRTPNVVFFLVPHQKHAVFLRERASIAAGIWERQINLCR